MSVQLDEIIGWTWFTPKGDSTFGVVIIQNFVGERKAYIGYIYVKEQEEQLDAVHIANTGAKFPIEEAISLLKKQGHRNLKCKYNKETADLWK